MDKYNSFWNKILDALSHSAEDSNYGYWSNGDLILCKTEEQANTLADFLEDCGLCTVATGYYDPSEDEKTGCADECTGYHYIDI